MNNLTEYTVYFNEEYKDKRFATFVLTGEFYEDKFRNIYCYVNCDCSHQKWMVFNHCPNAVCCGKKCAFHSQNKGVHWHKDKGTKEYNTWLRIKSRCYNPNNPSYNRYGAIGLTVCDKWKNNYSQFIKDMGRAPTKSHSIDRIDGNKGYSADNCRWATQVEQQQNTKRYILKRYPDLVELLHEDFRLYPNDSRATRAKRLSVPYSSLKNYIRKYYDK